MKYGISDLLDLIGRECAEKLMEHPVDAEPEYSFDPERIKANVRKRLQKPDSAYRARSGRRLRYALIAILGLSLFGEVVFATVFYHRADVPIQFHERLMALTLLGLIANAVYLAVKRRELLDGTGEFPPLVECHIPVQRVTTSVGT